MTLDNAHADRLAHFMLKRVNKAVREMNMICEGDRIAVALSGGKDSFSLLEILRYRQRFSREKYSIVAVHVVGDTRGPEMPPYPEMEQWLSARGIEHMIRPTHMAENEEIPVPCERCTWNRRRTLFEMAGDLDCNKVAFGHHLDDLAETVLLNMVHQGRIDTMPPMADYFGGTLAIIRPLVYVPERDVRRFADACDFPPPPPLCPRGEHTQRQRMKELLVEMEKDCPKVRWNLVRGALQAQKSSLISK